MQNTRWSDIATCLAKHGVAPGASISVADAALVRRTIAQRSATPCAAVASPPPLRHAGVSLPRPWHTTRGPRSASSPTRSRRSTGLLPPRKPMRVRSHAPGRRSARWSSTPARRTNGGSSGWHARSRHRRVPCRLLRIPQSSRRIAVAPMQQRRRRSSAPCPQRTI